MPTPPFRIVTALALAGAAICLPLLSRSASAQSEASSPKLAAYVPKAKGTLTYTKDVAPILLQNCVNCHHPGAVAPFSLLNYRDAKKRATQLTAVTQSRFMPPWHAESHGEFQDERKLTPQQIGIIKQWADEGAHEGKSAEAPQIPQFSQDWSLGQPDQILQPSKVFTLGAEGEDVRRCFVIPTSQTEDRYVAAIEVRPGNSKIVHHVIVYLNSDGKAKEWKAKNADGQPGYPSYGGIQVAPSGTLGFWVPGSRPQRLPDGVGIFLPKGTDVVLHVHYHRSGKKETDQTKLALYYCKKPVDKRLRITATLGTVDIPAGEANYTSHEFFPVPFMNDVSILGVFPHMHLLGKDMTITANLPNKSTQTLLRVPQYDFNWQTTYMYKQPVKLPAGSTLTMLAHFNNSAGNPRNPSNPPKTMAWGEQTADEMSLSVIFYTIDGEHLTQGITVQDKLDGFNQGKTLASIGAALQRQYNARKSEGNGSLRDSATGTPANLTQPKSER